MTTQIIIANNCNVPRGEIMAVVGGDHPFSENETMEEWVKAGGLPEDWDRKFSKVIVSDKEPEELRYLLDPYVSYVTAIPTKIGNKYHCVEPEKTSPLYMALESTGQVEVTMDLNHL